MSPSSPVSLGMFPSNRTLEAGSVQFKAALLEHGLLAEEPFVDATSSAVNVKLVGTTIRAGIENVLVKL